MMKYTVTILQHRLLHYRVSFFNLLRQRLRNEEIELKLVHGQSSPSESIRKDEGFLPWATKIHNSFVRVGGVDICWQHIPVETLKSDLVILMQENRILNNYFFLLRRKLSGGKIAFWGHGANFQSQTPKGYREKWKNIVLHHVDWWFAYTQATVDILIASGYPAKQISCLNNSVDTASFRMDIDAASCSVIQNNLDKFNIPNDAVIGLFCGSLYSDKKLDFLIEAVDIIKATIPDFHMVVIGDGPDAYILENAYQTRQWIHCLGIRKGIEKAALFKVSKVLLNPGLVGLHVVDSFCAGLPMVTTSGARHSPEFVYIKSPMNGLVTGNSVNDYAQGVISLLLDEGMRCAMACSALESAQDYSLNNMVNNMKNGIVSCMSGSLHHKNV